MNTTKKRILIFTDCMIFGGCEIVLTNIANSQTIKEHYQIIYSYRNYKEYREQLLKRVDNNITFPLPLFSNESFYYNISLKKNSLPRKLIWNLLSIIDYSKIYYLPNFIVLFRVFKKLNPDILFINNGGYPGAKSCRFAALVAKLAGIRTIIFNVNNMAFPSKSILDKMYDRIVDKSVDIFVTASKAAGIRLSEVRGFSQKKLFSIPNTVKEISIKNNRLLRQEFEIDNKALIIGSVGLLTKRKGFDILIKSIHELRNRNPKLNFKLVIFGEGEEKHSLNELLIELNLNDFVLLPGHYSNVIDYISGFDVFVLPSNSNEDMPYVILEAMMLKKPVIGTSIAGIPEEIADGETGFIVEPRNYDQLSKEIEFLLKYDNIRHSFGENGYQKYLKEFSYDVIMNRYLSLFNDSLLTK